MIPARDDLGLPPALGLYNVSVANDGVLDGTVYRRNGDAAVQMTLWDSNFGALFRWGGLRFVDTVHTLLTESFGETI